MAYIDAKDDNFHELISRGFSVVDCYGDHCNPCRILAPIFEEVTTEMDYIRFIKLNTEHNPGITREYSINSIPTMLFIRDGEVVDRTVGVMPKEMIEEHIAALLYE
ncbi:MAG: thiol reductase thioredoxin [Lachnospiraceae bacterium]|nr:thiol reductase thioredoxin [Lachnospiraceae bacterium]